MDIERDIAGAAVLRCADPAGQSVLLAVHPVAAGIVGVEVPAEDVAVELLELGPVLARDLDMDNLRSHRGILLGCRAPAPGRPVTLTTNGECRNRQADGRGPARHATEHRTIAPRRPGRIGPWLGIR